MRYIGASALVITSLLVAVPHAKATVVAFASDTSWSTYNADPAGGAATLLGPAEYVALNASQPINQPAGTVQYGAPFDSGLWTADRTPIPGANWIWGPGITGTTIAPDFQKYYFSKNFVITGTPTAATISLSADDLVQVFVNGTSIGTYGSVVTPIQATQQTLQTFNFLPQLHTGTNIITVMAENGPGSFSSTYVPGQPSTYAQNNAGAVFGGSITVIPEPSSLMLLSLSSITLIARRRKTTA